MSTIRNNRVDLRQLLNPEKAIWPYSERENITSLAPFSLELHLSSFCNYNCCHCSYQNRRSNRLVVSESSIKKLVADIIDMEINGVYWSGGGEPTTIKGFPEYIEEISNSKTEQALITNGILIHDQWISLLKRFNYVAVSFQASRNKTYEKITGYNYRDKLYSDIRRLRDVLEETILGARCVINRHNYKEVDQIYKDAKDLGFDYLIFLPAVDYEGRGDVELNIEEQNYLIEVIKDLAPSLDDSFTNLRRMKNQRVSHYKKGEKGGFPCYTNYIRGTGFINYDGGVWLCQPHIGDPKYCIGNINRHRIIEIWNSERHYEVMELLDEEHKRGNCRNCRSIAYNKVLRNYILNGDGISFYDPFL